MLHDLDRDGALDWIRLDLAGPTRVDFGRCGGGSWLQLRLRQPGANPFAVGARVVATFDGGAVAGTVRAGGVNYASGGPPECTSAWATRTAWRCCTCGGPTARPPACATSTWTPW